MDFFSYQDGEAYCERVALSQESAQATGTPAYVYSGATLDRHCRELKNAFLAYPTLPCYAVKANHNLSLLKRIFSAGFGADVVSGGELERSLLAGAKSQRESCFPASERQMRRSFEAWMWAFFPSMSNRLENYKRLPGWLKRAEKNGGRQHSCQSQY